MNKRIFLNRGVELNDREAGLDGVGLAPEEGFDSHVHFRPFEEVLDSPACFVKQRDGERGQVKVVGEKNQELPGFRIAVDDAPKLCGVVLPGADNREPDDLVGDNALALRRAGMTVVEL